MKVWIRRFKSMDIVVADTETDASQVDQSDAAEVMELDYVSELRAEQFARMHKSWTDYLPGGTTECDTLAEIFAAQSANTQGVKSDG